MTDITKTIERFEKFLKKAEIYKKPYNIEIIREHEQFIKDWEEIKSILEQLKAMEGSGIVPKEKEVSWWSKNERKSRKLADMVGGAMCDGFNQCRQEVLLRLNKRLGELEKIIEDKRCKGCYGYPETPLKEIVQAITNLLVGEK